MQKVKNAFTLVELIIVILLISVLFAAQVFFSTGSNKLVGAANKLMFDLRYAQQLAISRQVSCGVSFNVAGNSYFVYIGSVSTKAKDPSTGTEFLVSYNNADYKGVNLVSTSFGDRLSFDYLGRPYDSGNALLSNQGSLTLQQAAYTKTVTIQSNTGEVKLP